MTKISRFNEDDLIQARGLNELTYCPRLYHLMYVQGLFDYSADTVSGEAEHSRRRYRTTKSELQDEILETPWPKEKVNGITLSVQDMGIIGKFDVVIESERIAFPVEDKHGPAPDGSMLFKVGPFELEASAWSNDQLQLAAQMALLRGNGYSCNKGRLYYRKSRKYIDIAWSQNLQNVLTWSVSEALKLRGQSMPEPLDDSPKCIRCSLNHICLPDETLFLKGKISEPRRLHPGREDAGILYLTTPGVSLHKNGENLQIINPNGFSDTVLTKDVSHVCAFGNVQISTQVQSVLVSQGVTISWFTSGGWLNAVTSAPITKNVMIRKKQFILFSQPKVCLNVTKTLVAAKIENQRTLLRRNSIGNVDKVLVQLKRLCNQTKIAKTIGTMRGIEGAAAKLYWSAFATLLKPPVGSMIMNGRNRRPPRDPVNAMLSYGYTLLLRDFISALIGTGLDPYFGFYHAMVAGRPALALDLMEAFRPLIVDSAALRAINNGNISDEDFLISQGNCMFKKSAKYKWIRAYEHRVDDLITHPAFGYRLSYRRVFYLEARLLARFLDGELENYNPLITR